MKGSISGRAARGIQVGARCLLAVLVVAVVPTLASGSTASGAIDPTLGVPPVCAAGVPPKLPASSPDGCAWQNGLADDFDTTYDRAVDAAAAPNELVMSDLPADVVLTATQRFPFTGVEGQPPQTVAVDRVGYWPATFPNDNQRLLYQRPGYGSWAGTTYNPASSDITLTKVGTCATGSASCTYRVDVPSTSFLRYAPNGDVQVLVPIAAARLDGHDGATWLPLVIHQEARHDPVSSFTVTPTSTAGRYQLVSTSTDPDPGDASQLTYDWSFDDTTAHQSGANVTHTFAKPGNHTATLKVTDPAGHTSTSTQTIEVAAPTLSVAISLKRADGSDFDTGSMSKGEVVTAKVTVAASAGGLGPLRGVTFPDGVLAAAPDGVVALDAPTPSPTPPFDLAPGASKQFTVHVTGVGAGLFTLTSAADAKDDAGHAVAQATAQRTSQVSDLRVEVTVDPDQLQLELDTNQAPGSDGLVADPRYVPKTTTVEVKITNEGTEAVDDVTFDGVTDGLTLTAQRLGPGGEPEPAPAPTPFPLDVTASDPTTIAQIPAGESTTVSFTIEATNGGRYDIAAPVHGTAASTGSRVSGSGHAPLRVLTDVKLLAQVKVSTLLGRPPQVDEGQDIPVFGTLKNLTTDETITLDPIRTLLSGNGQALGPIDFGEPVPEGCDVGTFAATLAPGESKSFTIWVKTMPIGVLPGSGVRVGSFLTLTVAGASTTDEGTAALDESEVRLELGNGKTKQGDVTGLRTSVSTRLPDPTLLTDFGALRYAYGAFTKNLVDGVDAAGASVLPTLGAMARATPGLLLQALESTPGVEFVRQEIALAEYYYRSIQTLSTGGRKALLDQITADLAARYHKTGADIAELRQQVAAAVDAFDEGIADWFTRIDRATDAGDAQKLIEVVAEPAAPLGQGIAEQVAGEAVIGAMCRVFKGAAASDLSQAAAKQEASAAGRVEAAVEEQAAAGDPRAVPATDAMRALEPWDPISPAQAGAGWTVDGLTDSNLRRFTDVNNGGLPVQVAVRSRAEATVDWLASKGGGTLKPEAYKPKMVNPFDVDYLGYRAGKAGAGGDIGSGVLAQPIPQDLLESRLGGLDAKTQDVVRKRWAKRYKEWYGVEPGEPRPPGTVSKVDELKALAPNAIRNADGRIVAYEGTIKVPKKGTINYAPNIDTAGRPVQLVERRIQLRVVDAPPDAAAFPDGREYYEVWLEANDGPPGQGSMRRLVGDVDIVAVLGQDGRILASQPGQGQVTAAAVADQLTSVAGAQHGWTYTWDNPAGRAELLAEHVWDPDPAKRGAPLLVYANGEARVAWFDPNKAYASPDGGNPFVFLEGAPRTLDPVEVPVPGELGLPDPSETALPTGWVSPLDALPFANGIDGGVGKPANCPVTMGVGPTAQVLRVQGGQPQQWTSDGGWTASDVGRRCQAGTLSPVQVLPQTALSTGSTRSARATRISVLSTTDVGTDAAGWFQPGDRIVIDPGGDHEERATVASISPFALTAPLAKPHDAMEVITYEPGFVRVAPPTTTTTAAPTTTSTVAPTTAAPATTAPTVATGTLPRTGTDPVELVWWGLALLGIGGFLIGAASRLRQAR